MTTEAPAAAILRAVSAPIPRAAPETNATLPSKRFMSAPSLPPRLVDCGPQAHGPATRDARIAPATRHGTRDSLAAAQLRRLRWHHAGINHPARGKTH